MSAVSALPIASGQPSDDGLQTVSVSTDTRSAPAEPANGAHAPTDASGRTERSASPATRNTDEAAGGGSTVAVPAGPQANPTQSEREAIVTTYKELAAVSGAADAWQSLKTEIAPDRSGASMDASGEGDAAPRRRGDEDHPSVESRLHGPAAPRTEQQRRVEDLQASFLLSKLVDDVFPWAVGAIVVYASVYAVRLLLAYSRLKAERRRKRRHSSIRRSRSARLD